MSTSNHILSPQPSNINLRPPNSTKTPKQQQHQQQQQQQSNNSYTQPIGSFKRINNGSPSKVRPASWSEPSNKGKNVVRTVGGRKRNVHCDVIVEGIERMKDGTWTLPEAYKDCIYALGSPFEATEPAFTSTSIQPPTPKKAPSVDQAKVRQHLRELWTTEENYLRKVRSLYQDFALPLRAFAGDSRTAVIPKFEAKVLFSNLEEIVPIAEAFVADLREIIGELNSNSEILPMRFGEVILQHVQQMAPFKKWLASVTQSESIYQNLIKSNSAFKTFIETAQIVSRERAQTTSGFKEFLAEPFQRVSRYRLMIDPMIRHLSVTDGNVEPLEEAVKLLSNICSMQVDEQSRRTAAMWSLMTTIEGFPPAMIHFDRHFIDCLDVNEIVDSSSSSTPNILKCTLYLFTDKLLIAKRPSGEKGGRQHAGLDNIDNLVQLYSTSNLTNTQNNLLGSPKKLKKDVMGFRGVVDVMEVVGIDFGEQYMGLVFDNPPVVQSERWSGRSARRFEVASTYPSESRKSVKETFLNHLTERHCLIKSAKGALTMKSPELILGGAEPGDETVVYWSIWQREMWESAVGGRLRSQIALQLDEDGEADDLDYGFDGKPSIVARATLLENPEMCRFSARTRNRAMRPTENIQFERLTLAIAEIGTASGHFDFPQNRPSTPSGSVRSRPRSLLLSASSALDIFAGGSASLKRTLSTASRSSNATTASYNSWAGSSVGSMTPSLGSLSPNPSAAAKFFKKNSPNWYGGGSPAPRSVSEMEDSRYEQSFETTRMEEDDDDDEGDRTVEILKPGARNSPADDRRRRHSSLPPPAQPRFESVSPRPIELSPAPTELSYRRSHNDILTTTATTTLSHSASEVFSPTIPRGQMSLLSPTTHLPVPTQNNLSSPRRRMMGPRDIGSPAPSPVNSNYSVSPAGSTSSSIYDPRLHSDSKPRSQTLPFARNDSPPPPNHLQSQQKGGVERSNTLPLSLLPRSNDYSNSSASKRPLYDASPRASPAKKLAPISTESSRQGHSSTSRSPNELRVRVPSGSVSGKGRNSGESNSSRRNRRNGSEVSTIRGGSPPLVMVPDLSSGGKDNSPVVIEEVAMENPRPDEQEGPKEIIAVADSNSTPAEKLKVHIWQLRNKLNLESVTKENSSGISRSPHTRNVFAQLNNTTTTAPLNPSNSLRKAMHESKNSLDLPALYKWADRLNELVDHLINTVPDSSTSTPEVKEIIKYVEVEVPVEVRVEVEVPSGIKKEDLDRMREERDLGRLELEELKIEMELLKSRPIPMATSNSTDLLAQIESLSKLNATLTSQYDEMTESIEEMYTNFDEDLAEARLETFEDELATIFTVVRSGAEHDLAGALHTAVKEKKRLELELESLKMRISG